MKTLGGVLLFVAIAAASLPALAKTATAQIGESATIVPGNTVSAYVIGGNVVTVTRDDALHEQHIFGNPIVSVGFQMSPSWYLVKRVTWDKRQRTLTIDF